MNISIITVANRPEDWLTEAESGYIKGCPWSIEIFRLPLLNNAKGLDANARKEKEAERIFKKIDSLKPDCLLVLDEQGASLNSPELSKKLDNFMLTAKKMVFIIGGPDGTSDALRKKADLTLSLSPMTFPHHLARLILVEQLYRASMILKGHPYHR